MPQDLELLQGVWSIRSLDTEGQSMPAEMLADARITVKGDRFTSTGMGAEYAGKIELDPLQSPRQIDMKFDAGPEAGNTNRGIYDLDGDTWRLCLATSGTVRPADFSAAPGSGFALETLVRGEAPPPAKARTRKKAAPPAAKGDTGPATEFEGEWPMISGTMSGKPMDQSMVKWVKRVTHGNQTKVQAGPQVMLHVEFTLRLHSVAENHRLRQPGRHQQRKDSVRNLRIRRRRADSLRLRSRRSAALGIRVSARPTAGH